MYGLYINTSKYDINLLVYALGKKTSKTIKENIKKTNIPKMMKRLKKTVSHCNMEKLHIPA